MLGTDYPDTLSNIPLNEGRELIRYVKSCLTSADIAIGNLEGTISDTYKCTKIFKDSISYVFRMPPLLAPRLAEAGFDVLNTANNHANDFGEKGRYQTESILDSLGIAHTGRIGKIASLEIRGTKIAVIGFSPNYGNYSLLDVEKAVALTDSLDKKNDIVVVTFHGGAEGKESIHLPEGPEFYLGENRGDLRKFTHSVIDGGADIVFGHGPHVPRAIELYSGRIIAYSLGNFCTWFGVNVRNENGLAPVLMVEVDTSGALIRIKIISFEQHTNHYPVPDPLKKAEKLIIGLSESDIGNFPYEFYDK